ncbi:MAG: arginine--tRNA ligase [Pirellulaceae bacterium]|nr:arginine--tRNA ligase [Pirellulaceae bacterium]
MNILKELRGRFEAALKGLAEEPAELLEMIRPAQDARFGDYQANCAMPLAKRLGQPPREVAARIVAALDVGDLCEPPEIAGPGFINLRLRGDWLIGLLRRAVADPRLTIAPTAHRRTYVIDYSSPNVAKPMHVGHIRSTVIGDALYRILSFLGHRTISDNHLGDWGTQFGMIIFGYKHFLDREAYERAPVAELSRLYKLVNQLVDYHEDRGRLPELEARCGQLESEAARLRAASEAATGADVKPAAKALRRAEGQLEEARQTWRQVRQKLADVDADPRLSSIAASHAEIGELVLRETARLHADDPENLALWHEFLPACRQEIQKIYDQLGVRFDVEYGESFYQHLLAAVVEDFQARGLSRESEGATCVFLDGFDAPMIIRKRDGAFLYSTTDLATIKYRLDTWRPDAILYVVDHRQSEHFQKLFAAARLWGYHDVELRHISFGTVLGEDGRPFRTRAGDTVGLEGLLETAEQKAWKVVCENDDAKPQGAELSDEQRRHVARVVGHAAIKYADLSHNRTSDYVFSYDKMVALEGNTATYMQYSYARMQSIFDKGGVRAEELRERDVELCLDHPQERGLALELLRFEEALTDTLADYRPNLLTGYLFGLARRFSEFYEQCPVLKAPTPELRDSRLLLCDLTGRSIRLGLELLGIEVVERM